MNSGLTGMSARATATWHFSIGWVLEARSVDLQPLHVAQEVDFDSIDLC
jgi:hypothetical protein